MIDDDFNCRGRDTVSTMERLKPLIAEVESSDLHEVACGSPSQKSGKLTQHFVFEPATIFHLFVRFKTKVVTQ